MLLLSIVVEYFGHQTYETLILSWPAKNSQALLFLPVFGRHKFCQTFRCAKCYACCVIFCYFLKYSYDILWIYEQFYWLRSVAFADNVIFLILCSIGISNAIFTSLPQYVCSRRTWLQYLTNYVKDRSLKITNSRMVSDIYIAHEMLSLIDVVMIFIWY